VLDVALHSARGVPTPSGVDVVVDKRQRRHAA
jgi:hypothetical protein